MDKEILFFLNSLTDKSSIIDSAAIFVSFIFPFIFAALHFLFFLRIKKLKLWLITMFLAGGTFFVKEVISIFYFRLRPYTLEGVNQIINNPLGEASFPSLHTAISFLLAFSIFWINKKIGLLFLLLALLISVSRIVVGVHFPTDILGGFLLAFLLSLVIRRVVK